jgi:hypothetical protein
MLPADRIACRLCWRNTGEGPDRDPLPVAPHSTGVVVLSTEGGDMAKVTARGWGAEGTNALQPDYFDKQGERWPGRISSTSSVKPGSFETTSEPALPLPVLTTEPHLKRDLEESFTADSTDGLGEAEVTE